MADAFQTDAFQTSGDTAFQVDVAETPVVSYHPRRRHRPRLHWTIEDLPVELEGWRANVLAFGGYDRMEGLIPERVVRRHAGVVDVGARITAYDSAGAIRWQGEIPDAPEFDEGMAKIQAAGAIRRAHEARDRLMYQIQNVELFSDAHGAPHNFSGGTLVDGRARKTDLYYQLRKDEAYPATGDDSRYQLALWVPGSPGGISRVAGSIAKSISTVNAEFRLRRFTGPSGTVTDVATYGLDTADPTTFDTTISSPEDAIMLTLQVASAHTPTQNRIFRLYGLKVNGITAGDTFFTSEIAADIGGRLGYDTAGVLSSGLNGLPFDLAAGSSWAEEGLFYMAMLSDWRCLVLAEDPDRKAGPVLDFGPWARSWTVQRASDALPDLRAMPIHNQVIVVYTDGAGRQGRVTVDADGESGRPVDPFTGTPLAGKRIPWTETLTDVQPDESLATSVANYLLPLVVSRRFAGRIEISGARAEDGTGDLYAPRGGDVVELADWAPLEAASLRVFEVELRPDGATLGIESPVSASGLIAGMALRRAREGRISSRGVRLHAA